MVVIILTNSNVTRLEMDGKEVILIGTAHVSKKSADEVKELIEQEQPDTVCVELCQARYQGITDADKWKNTDIIKVIKEGKSLILLVNLIVSSYQKRLAKQFGIQPGQEMIQGIESAKEVGATLCLADRYLQTTMVRLWRTMGFFGKMKLIAQLIVSMFVNEEISEEELEKMKSQDMLAAALDELSKSFPEFKSIIIDERDKYLAQKIKDAPGNKIVAVLGAGHIPGIKEELFKDNDLKDLSKLPPPSKVVKVIAWSIPVIIIGIIAATFSVDRSTGIDQMTSWILWNGSLAALGALLAFAHPLAILVAFAAAPFTTLNPLLAAGWFAGLTQALLKKPSVKDFESLSEDVQSIKGFWRNKVSHILIVVILTNLGSSLGTIFGGADVIRHFVNTFFG